MKPTIQEIAKAAGVSATTVDRVLNGRPNVHPRTITLVQQARDSLTDRNEARVENLHRPLRVAFIVHAGPNAFLDAFTEALASEAALARRPIEVAIHRVSIGDANGLASVIDRASESSDALGVMPIRHPAVREAMARIPEGKPSVALLSPLSGGSAWPFVGQDNFAAGRAAGFLMGRFLAGRKGRVGIIAGSLAFPAHEERERGFRRIMRDEFPTLDLGPTLESNEEQERATRAVRQLLADDARTVGLYNIGGWTEAVADVLRGTDNNHEIVAIEHDLTAATRRALVDGVLSAVVHQDPVISAREAIATLLALLHEDRGSVVPQLTRIEIITRENLP